MSNGVTGAGLPEEGLVPGGGATAKEPKRIDPQPGGNKPPRADEQKIPNGGEVVWRGR